MGDDSFAAISLQEGYLLHEHYKILNVLGRGGFAFTYKAQDQNLDRFVAVKEYFPSSIAARSGLIVTPIDANSKEGYADGLNSFIKEAQTLAKFRNEHICSVLDYFQENGTAYLIMPYLSGESLDMVLKKCPNGVMNSDAVRKWLIPLLDALRELHDASYMHRDIKPSNIYITFEGEPILIDFGAARASVGRTHGYTVVLTPEYAPPEQSTTDISSQGPWTDIYALAAVAYRCLMGTPPPDAQKRIIAIANGEADPLDSGLSNLKSVADAGLYAFIENALVLPYAKRIRSVDGVLARLKSESISIRKSQVKSKPKSSSDLTSPPPPPSQPHSVMTGIEKLENFTNMCMCFAVALLLVYTIIYVANKDKVVTEAMLINQYQEMQKQAGKHQPNYQQPAPQQPSHQENGNTYQFVLKNHDEGISNYKNGLFGLAASNFSKCLSYRDSGSSSVFLEKQATCANYLAVMLSEGKGMAKNDVEAFKLFTFAANAGKRSAQYNLAKRYKNGIGTQQNIQSAVYWYTKAAQAGDIDAAKALGNIYENGYENFSRDLWQALEWYYLARRLSLYKDKDVDKSIKRVQKKMQ